MLLILLSIQRYVNLILNVFLEPNLVNVVDRKVTKNASLQVLLSRVSFFGPKDISNSNVLQKYRESAEAVMCGLLPKSPTATASRTDSNLPSDACFFT